MHVTGFAQSLKSLMPGDDARQSMSARRWLAVGCAVTAACVIAETVLRWPAGHLLSYLLIPGLALASLVVLPLAPQSGAWLTVTLYCVGLVSPFPMSYSYSLAMLMAVAVIWTDSRLAASLSAALGVTALMVDRKLLFGLGLSDSVVVSFAYCVFALTIGVASRWSADRARLTEQVRRQTERECIAMVLHDRISNDLAYAIMRIDRDLTSIDDAGHRTSDGDERDAGSTCGAHANATSFDVASELRELRTIVDHALHGTHQVITTLDDTPATTSTSSSRSFAHDTDTVERIVACVDEQEDRLRALGFAGQTTLPDVLPSLSDRGFDELTGLLSEIYANIAKHGDPSRGYVVSIAVADDSFASVNRRDGTGPVIIITATDVPRRRGTADGLNGLGSGLERYRRMGVDVETHVEDGQWVLSARLEAK
ncbi:Signal transduction histidine kinase-like protein [Bifidobacterium biavatii DSM 23969]|uniref:Signal transduction histidine kinase-like protein n=2 Tax=Bifidobacterium biavatii TaxID=762212 RepID=A0A087A0L1_9BIFI|nr:Signal transduction histidine kinase-like protein [Bifidobacterium biavatii DSM 23969]